MKFGLEDEVIEKIVKTIAIHEEVECVIVYGSRAKGNYRYNSDIELTIEGKELSHKALFQIEQQLDDLLLPWNIDLSVKSEIKNEDLIKEIETYGEVIYKKK